MKKIFNYSIILATIILLNGCKKDFLTENPKDQIYADNLFKNYEGFNNALNSIYALARLERASNIGSFERSSMWKVGTDSYWANYTYSALQSFDEYGPGLNASNEHVAGLWDWLYDIVNSSNMVISRAENPDVDWQDGNLEPGHNKNLVIAQARFFRAWAYRHLTYTFGDVPLSTEEIGGDNYRTDWQRDPVSKIREVMEQDWLFAEKYLPDNYNNVRILPNAVAQHYLAELYLAMAEDKGDQATVYYQKAEEKALAASTNSNFALITSRYGVDQDKPGNAFMDQFKDGNSLPSQGNTEALWVFLNDPDLSGSAAIEMRRSWVNRYYTFTSNLADYGGRGIGRLAHTYWAEKLYEQDDDRYSQFALRKYFVKDNGDTVFTKVKSNFEINDPYWPNTMKWDYVLNEERATDNSQYNSMPYVRLAETYLLLAEAQMKLNQPGKAVVWINKIRSRSHASEISASDVTLDFILAERTRELLTEEERRHTLNRLGLLVVRTKLYNPRAANIDAHNVLFPIPQDFIDTNTGTIKQNPDYF